MWGSLMAHLFPIFSPKYRLAYSRYSEDVPPIASTEGKCWGLVRKIGTGGQVGDWSDLGQTMVT